MEKNTQGTRGLPGPEDARRTSDESKYSPSMESKRPSLSYSEQSDPNRDNPTVSTAPRQSNARNTSMSMAQDSNQFSSESNASSEFHDRKSVIAFNDNQDERHDENVCLKRVIIK